jgi:hypothetical protein
MSALHLGEQQYQALHESQLGCGMTGRFLETVKLVWSRDIRILLYTEQNRSIKFIENLVKDQISRCTEIIMSLV